MPKPFLDVFPTLNLDREGRLLLEETEVLKLSAPRKGGKLRIYLGSNHLIPRTVIADTERQIERQIFRDASVSVRIYESYSLGEAYTPSVIISEYRDNILYQLREQSPLDYTIFKGAKAGFVDDTTLSLTLEDTFISRQRGAELADFLEDVYRSRFGIEMSVVLTYKKNEPSEDPQKSHRRGRSAEQDIRPGDVADMPSRELSYQAVIDSGDFDISFSGGYLADDEWAVEERDEEDNALDSASAASENAGANTPGNTASNAQGNTGANTSGSSEAAAADNNGASSAQGESSVTDDHDKPQEEEKPLMTCIKSDHKDVLFGREITLKDGAVTDISELEDIPSKVVIRGRILKAEDRESRKKPIIIRTLDITDDTDTIKVKFFIPSEEAPYLSTELMKKGTCIKVKGTPSVDTFDHELTMGRVDGIMRIPEFAEVRVDKAPEGDKRIELHCHTKMSDMDGVSSVSDIIKRAYKWGHKAIAITDHGVVQAFPDAFHTVQALHKAENARRKDAGLEPVSKEDFFRVIYGVEAYMVNDETGTVIRDAGQDFTGTFVVFDIETTGFSPVNDRIIEIGAVKLEGGEITDRFSTFVNPKRPIPYRIEKLTTISDKDVADAPYIEDVFPQFMEFCRGAVLVAHNAYFDIGFIEENAARLGVPFEFTGVDTLGISRYLFPAQSKHKLDTIAKRFKIEFTGHHRAVNDAEVTALIFRRFIEMLAGEGITTLEQLADAEKASPRAISKMKSYHTIILAANETGRVNLYRLISRSHLDYFNGKPRMPKSLIRQHREGLIIGSACEAGELYMGYRDGLSDEKLAAIADFYDYLEIQPVANNMFLIEDEKVGTVNSVEDLQKINRRITELGDRIGKPVCATCDVHFLDPHEEIYRRIIMVGRGFKDGDNQAPLYLHTTDEMLEEFSYLGDEKAREVVIDNPAAICAMTEYIEPVRPDKCAPVIPGSDEILRRICETKAKSMYGDPLPQIVSQRLERELNSIITNGFAVMYIIAQKLVWKSMEDGYLVGSRGSVGSSFVATMSGITEVNPLPPHYYCSKCHYSDFDSEDVKAYFGRAGCDMPDKVCPVCGEKLCKDGFDIPFETFLGFNGDKEPDIDLNFSGEYQSKAHKYTEVIFGAGQTYRAGTVGTVAEKTAYGFVKKYFEEHGISKRGAEIDRLAGGIAGIRRSTGQHPGGIIVLPVGQEIDSFTPVQHPADDNETDIVTTHFDYHSIDHNLLKLDILGHADPTMIRRLSVLTDTDPLAIPLDDAAVMSLFRSPEALGITPAQIGGTQTGTRGVPEFGTDFAIGMLLDTKPTCLSDLVRIAGLAHGTDVWLGNAKDLILSGTATISTAICTRDDIMTYLIGMGVEPALSFKIMESVRKGKGLTPDMEASMREAEVPDWYIDSCKKIKYMFPKAHAAAYVMMAWRIAWYKINYPLAYYTAYFSIRASAFSYDKMCRGLTHLKGVMEEIAHKKEVEKETKIKVSPQELNTYDDCQIVQEMYERGFEFMPVDLYRAKARDFQIIDGRIMPSFASIDGVGDKAAEGLYQAAMDGPFISKDDLRTRSGLSKTSIETLTNLGLLEGMPETNQLNIFDFMGE